MGYVIGVDTGGTFTDVVLFDDAGVGSSAKAATTPSDLAVGVENALTRLAEERRVPLDDLLAGTDILRFSGTTATNALLTYSGARTGMLTTAGFEDTLAIARAVSGWAGMTEGEVRHAYQHRKPPALVPRSLIRGLDERIDWKGDVVVALDRAQVEAAVDELAAAGVEAIAVCLMWSIRNPDHEVAVRELIRERHGEISVHLSHQVAASVGEYERFMTTVSDAYVGPVLNRFLSGLDGVLRTRGFGGQLLLAQADGGCLYPEETRPVFTLNSGPAGGVIASAQDGELLGFPNVVATDVGGTSFDVGLVAEGSWLRAREPVIGKFHLSLPMIEVESVGAGGGSIAWVDELGILHVGPRSAGAYPGPAAYALGGTAATVTDADIVLGYLNPDYFLDGKQTLDRGLAVDAVGRLGAQLGLDVLTTAAGIFEIANSHMAGLLRRRVVARGYDPRDFALFAYGGAGGMHCAFYAREAGMSEVVVPALAGTFSARGIAAAPLLHHVRRDEFAPMPMEPDAFNAALAALEQEVVTRLDRDHVDAGRRRIVPAVAMRYGSQVHTVRLEIERKTYDADALAQLCEAFDREYEKLYGRGSGYAGAGRFLIAFTVDGYGTLPAPDRGQPAASASADALIATRDAHFEDGMQPTRIYRYERLAPGTAIEAPAIVEAPHTTVVIPPGTRARIDEHANLRMEV
jgi:N-methylhydantoinase A